MHRSLILLFLKAPVRGRVKSRLSAALGEDAALELYRGFVLDIVDTIDATGHPCTICHDPPDAQDAVAMWLGTRRRYLPQTGDDLGSRMKNAFRMAFAEGASRAILIGSDIPDFPGEVLGEAFSALGKHDAVIGPTADGGYYLIGFRSGTFRPGVFHDMAWSTDQVYPVTRARLDRAGSRVHTLRLWRDVDTVEDLHALQRRAAGTAFERSHTMPIIRKHCGTMEAQ